MGSYGMTGLRRKILGRKATETIINSSIPVITLPPSYQWSSPLNIVLAIGDTLQKFDIIEPVMNLA